MTSISAEPGQADHGLTGVFDPHHEFGVGVPPGFEEEFVVPPRLVESTELKHRDEPVAGGVHLPPAEPSQDVSDRSVVSHQEIPPAPVAKIDRPLRRPDDVGEEDRGELALATLLVVHQEKVATARNPRLLFSGYAGAPAPRSVTTPLGSMF